MLFTNPTKAPMRIAHELPPSAPLPAALQTLACRLWPLAYFEGCRARYGDRFTVRPVDMPPLVFLSNPREMRAVLAAPPSLLRTGTGSEVVVPLFGEEAFMLREGEEHMCGRNTVLPAFHRRVMPAYTEMVTELVASEVDSWPQGEPFAVYPRLSTLTLRVIMRAMFGGEGPTFTELHERLLKMLSVMSGLLLQEPRLRHLPGWRGAWRRFARERSEVHQLIAALVAQRRKSGERGGDLLEILLAAHNQDGSPMSDQQIHDNLVSVLIAGHETTASELAWAFQLLAHHPRAQARLIEEIDGARGEEYLTATIHEVLRCRPVFPFAGPRAVVNSIEIEGYTYRSPTQLLPCIYLVHHDPELYPDPHEFRPERFLGSSPQPRIWLPWGGGRKRCVGQHLAMLEMHTVLRATLLDRQVLPAARSIERECWRSVLLTPKAGSRIVLRRRIPARGPHVRPPAQVAA
jgi:cytochrome P450